MKKIIILPMLLVWFTSVAQTIHEGYKAEPRFAYADSKGMVHLYNQYYQVRLDYIMVGNPRLQHLTFDVNGTLVDSVINALDDENQTFRLEDGYVYNDTIMLIGGKVTKGQPRTWQLHLSKETNSQIIKDTTIQFHNGLDSSSYRLEDFIINSRGNMVCLVSNANYSRQPVYYAKYHFFEINMQSLAVVKYTEMVLEDIPHSFMFTATNMAENRATRELWVSTGNLETLIFNASTFSFKQFVDQRYDRVFTNPMLPIPGDTTHKQITVAGWRNVDDNGVLPSDWLDRGNEACIYWVNEDLSIDTVIFFESDLNETSLAPWANNIAVIDTGNAWLAMGAYEYPGFPMLLDEDNMFSEVNVWKTSITGNIQCQSTWFANQTEKNYTPWQVVPTSDDGVMIFGTVNPIYGSPSGSRTNLFYLKLNSNCELTSIKEWSVNNYNPLQVYPNPVQEELHLKLDVNEELKGAIFNNNGQQVKVFNTKKVDVINLPAGIYVVEVKTKKYGSLTSQFIKN
jgi:hypothetical protein